ncbi:MAG: methionine--tRNA ligase [Patescibacteria group bacterium]
MDKKFFVTTPIYYINDRPHIGSAYTTVVADALARAHRLRGDETFFLTGTDENSQKNVEAAEKAGEKDLQKYLDNMAAIWQSTWKTLGISYDDFIRTTEERHLKAVERFWKAVDASGDIYKDTYEREYCTGCEEFKTAAELVDGKCPLHPNRELEIVSEENYFFRASNYRDDLLKLYHEKQEFVQPVSRQNEIRNYVKQAMGDFSISRESKKISCGIPVPGDDTQRIYVWFDALINYMSAVGYGTDDKLFKKWWPASLHLIGKDIIKFHCALWPAMIMSAAKSDELLRDENNNALLPERVFAHGFFTVDGQKMSKSLGNVVDPLELIKEYPFDVIRYFLLREIPFGEDGDFSEKRLAGRYSSDLGNTLGNLLNRAVSMSRKYFDNKVPTLNADDAKVALANTTWAGAEGLETLWQSVDAYINNARLDLALEAIWTGEGSGLIAANKYVEETKPFKLAKEDMEKCGLVLYSLLESCRHYAWMLQPVMPDIAKQIIEQLGQDYAVESKKNFKELKAWGGLKPVSSLPEPKILFPKML